VPRLVVQERQDDELRRPLLRLADGPGELHGAGLYSGVQNIVNREAGCCAAFTSLVGHPGLRYFGDKF
jgi:hypothetical protein